MSLIKWAALALAVFFGASVASAADTKRPNIVLAFADDWGRCASAYAQIDGPGTFNDLVQTPHFDRIAREGVLFRSAFVSAPSCTPCGSALLSGQHFWRTGRGAILNGAVWDDDTIWPAGNTVEPPAAPPEIQPGPSAECVDAYQALPDSASP